MNCPKLLSERCRVPSKSENPLEGHHACDQKLRMPWPLQASGVAATGPKLVTPRESLLGTSPWVLTSVPSCLFPIFWVKASGLCHGQLTS